MVSEIKIISKFCNKIMQHPILTYIIIDQNSNINSDKYLKFILHVDANINKLYKRK